MATRSWTTSPSRWSWCGAKGCSTWNTRAGPDPAVPRGTLLTCLASRSRASPSLGAMHLRPPIPGAPRASLPISGPPWRTVPVAWQDPGAREPALLIGRRRLPAHPGRAPSGMEVGRDCPARWRERWFLGRRGGAGPAWRGTQVVAAALTMTCNSLRPTALHYCAASAAARRRPLTSMSRFCRSAWDTPGIRPAWPRSAGRTRASFSRASALRVSIFS